MAVLDAEGIKARAREIGFDLCGIARAAAYDRLACFDEWLARGHAGEMHYLARSAERRRDVRHVLPSARSVISLATLYHTDRPYSTEVADPGEALVSRYAWGDDYHEVIGARLASLVAWMREASDVPFDARPYVDTGHVQERLYAEAAGLGWVGKNTCLINPVIGSWVFLSEVLCSLDLAPDEPGLDQCGTCTLCLDACPTGALVEPGVLDARRCLAYLTIELKGEIPGAFHSDVGTHVFGCDICQEVCPYNQAPPVSEDPHWQPRPALDRPRVADLAAMTDEELRTTIRGTALERARIPGLRRNLAVVAANAARHGG